jgi:hypothetical protein
LHRFRFAVGLDLSSPELDRVGETHWLICAQEASFREDNRRVTNGEQTQRRASSDEVEAFCGFLSLQAASRQNGMKEQTARSPATMKRPAYLSFIVWRALINAWASDPHCIAVKRIIPPDALVYVKW